MKKIAIVLIAFIFCGVFCACDNSSYVEPIELSSYEAEDLFDVIVNETLLLLDEMEETFEYSDNTVFSSVEDIEKFESMWKSLFDKSSTITNKLTLNSPPELYKENWNKLAACFKKVSSLFEMGTNFDGNNDGEYEASEMTEIFDYMYSEMQNVFQDILAISTDMDKEFSRNNTTNSITYLSCIECGNKATKKYVNPFSGKTENYCTVHYNEIVDMLGEMEEDVGKSDYSKHICESCYREGTHRYNSFTGPEYYCTEHYEELMDLLASLN